MGLKFEKDIGFSYGNFYDNYVWILFSRSLINIILIIFYLFLENDGFDINDPKNIETPFHSLVLF